MTTNGASLPGWGDAALVHCRVCDWSFLQPRDLQVTACPHCYSDGLRPLAVDHDLLPYVRPAEAYLPFALSEDQVRAAVRAFARGIPLAPIDLQPQRLSQRLQAVFLPRWLVDAEVAATWQAETGFNYDIVSHEERYDQNRGGWRTQQITETKVRWEPQVGRLKRQYHNVAAAALDEKPHVRRQLGAFQTAAAQPFRPETAAHALVRLPNRSPQDAWPEVEVELRKTAAGECRQAARADHLREFRWSPEFADRHWTLLLLPMYSTFYLDDEGRPRPVLIHGQSGRVSGLRRASMRRARRLASILAVIAAILLLASVLAVAIGSWLGEAQVQALGTAGVLVGLLVAASALAPLGVVWLFNLSQRRHMQVFL